MTDINAAAGSPALSEAEQTPGAETLQSGALPPPPRVFPLPTARRTLTRLLRVCLVGMIIFGYGPAMTYGWLVWLLNEQQWRWTYLMYFTEVPLLGGLFVVFVPWLSYRHIHHALQDWARGEPVERTRCLAIYERALQLPTRVAWGAFVMALVGYVSGTAIVHWQANHPMVEVMKKIPAIPLVGGMMGAFCYFGTARAMHPVVAWCSLQLRQTRPLRPVSLATKFLTTTCVLALAVLCLLVPSVYTLGQLVTEQHLSERSLERLRASAYRANFFVRPEDQWPVLNQAALGAHGYVFAMDAEGRIVSGHPRGYKHLAQERLYKPERRFIGREGTWVDRYAEHRVIAFLRPAETPLTLISVAYPSDFALPLRHFFRMALVVVVEVLVVVMVFGRYFTRGITTPLADLMDATRRIAAYGDFSQHVPVTTNDELGEVARSFNRMVEELEASKLNVEEYTKRLESSAQELSALNLEMEDLLRVVSHDLRAPLINIQGFSKRLEPIMQETLRTLDRVAASSGENGLRVELQALQGNVQSRFAESLRFISKSIEKMDALLTSLLAVSRVGRKADPMRPNALDEILDDVLATFEHQLKEQAIQVIRHPLPKAVPCRRNEINQVLSNLVSNAINYMGPTGRRCIEIGGTEADDQVECFVRDTGVGIQPEDHGRIFNMFTRLGAVDVPGEGVGLAYVKKILRSHGGKIRLDSQRGRGSTFYFTLPAQPLGSRGVTS